MGNNRSEELEIDLKDIFYLIKSKLLVILLSGMIGAFAAGLVTHFLITPIYTSVSKLYIIGKTSTLSSLADLQIGTQLTQDYMVLVKSRPVVDEVIRNLGLDSTYEEVVNMITLTNPVDTRILEIAVNHPNAYMAKEIVDEFANVSIEQIATIMDVDKPSIVEKGYMESQPSSPNIKMNVIIGGVLGIFLAGFVVILLYVLDDTIKSADDVENYLGVNTLGLIPVESTALKETKREKIRNKKEKKKHKEKHKEKGK